MTITCHVSTCSGGAAGRPGSISHPRSQLGASAPAHMCCADGRRARAAAASPVRAPCTLAVQPICMFTAAICPGLLNVCSQKHGQTKKMEMKKKPRRHVQGRLHKCCDCHRLLHSGGQEPFCSWTRTHPRHGHRDELRSAPASMLTSLNASIALAKPSPFSFLTSPLSATWAYHSRQPQRGPCLSKQKNNSPRRPGLLPSSNTMQS